MDKKNVLNEFTRIKAEAKECQDLLNDIYEGRVELSLEYLYKLSEITKKITSTFHDYLKDNIEYVQDYKDIRIEVISIKYILCRASDTLNELITKV